MYLISIITVIVVTLLVSMFSEEGAIMFLLHGLDGASIILLVLITVPMLIASGLLKDFNNAFRLALNKEKETNLIQIQRAMEAVKLVMKVLIFAGVFLAMLGISMILGEMDDPATIGPKLVVAMLSLIYALGIDLFLLPLKSKLKVKMIDYMHQQE